MVQKTLRNFVWGAGEIILVQAKVAKTKEEARSLLEDAINSGRAFEKLKEMVAYHKGNVNQIENPDLLPKAKYVSKIKSKEEGYLADIHALGLGLCAMKLGAGRKKKEDEINYAVGLDLKKKRGDFVKKGETLCLVHHDYPLEDDWLNDFYSCFSYTDKKIEKRPIIEEIIS